MRAILTVDMDGATFGDGEKDDAFGWELRTILRRLYENIEGTARQWMREHAPLTLRDSNGNRVGTLVIEE